MDIDRQFFVRDGVTFEKNNLTATAAHSYPRNALLQAQCGSWEDVAKRFVTDVLNRIVSKDYELGAMQMLYNAWFVVDEVVIADPTTLQPQPAQLQVNFFVRLGREPELVELSRPIAARSR